MAAEGQLPHKFRDRLKWGWDQLGWILPLVAVERALEEHLVQVAVVVVFWLIHLFIGSAESNFVARIRGRRRWQVGWALVTLGILAICGGVYLLAKKGAVQAAEVATTPAPPLSTAVALPQSASVPTAVDPPKAPSPPPSKQAAPIEWKFPQGVGDRSAEDLFAIGSGTAGHFVVRYRFTGTNKSNEYLTDVRAYVIPKNSGKRIDLQFEIEANTWLDTAKAKGIPPNATFILAGRIPGSSREEKVANTEEYLERYGAFTFFFECSELPPFSHSFAYSEVHDLLMRNKAYLEAVYTPPPRVTPKE